MKWILTFCLFCTVYNSFSQNIDVSLHGGAAPFSISAGVKNGIAGIGNASIAYTGAKSFDFGVHLSVLSKVTLATIISPGLHADAVIHLKDEDKHLLTAGIHVDYALYGNITKGGEYQTIGGVDTITNKIDNAPAYGIRLGYKTKITKRLYASILIAPTYCISTVHYTTAPSGKIHLLYVPFLLGISARL